MSGDHQHHMDIFSKIIFTLKVDHYEKFEEKLIFIDENEIFGKFPYSVGGPQTYPFHILKVSQG